MLEKAPHAAAGARAVRGEDAKREVRREVGIPDLVALSLPANRSQGSQRYGYCVDQGVRPYMEDAVDVCRWDTSEFYAVYDGHGGDGAVKYAWATLSGRLREHRAFNDTPRIGEVFREVFEATDQELLDLMCAAAPRKSSNGFPRTASTQRGSGLSPGCVACVALVRGGAVHVAHLGDCRACLCRADGSSQPVCVELTADHQAHLHDGEYARLKQEGVEVSGDGYLHGRINVSRAFGDWDWEAQAKCQGLLSRPDVVREDIDGDAEFLLIGCDGIFDKMTSLQAILIVRQRLRSRPGENSPQDAAEHLVRYAKKLGTTDNLSAVVVLFKAPAAPEGDTARTAPRLFAR